MNDRFLQAINQSLTQKVDAEAQTQMRDIKNHIINQFEIDEFGRAINLSMPELDEQETQTDAVEIIEPLSEEELQKQKAQ